MKAIELQVSTQRWKVLGLFAAGVLSAASALAQNYPSKAITLVYPFATGGPDRVVRLVASKMQESMGQPVIVDNRPGGSGLVGTSIVRRAAPDGHTLLVTSTSGAILMPLMTSPTPFNIETDFEPISLLYDFPVILDVSPSLGVANIRELIELAKAKPERANFGSPGAATIGRLVAEAFKQKSAAPFMHIAYKGVGEAQTAVMSGEVNFFMDGPQSVAELIRAGRLKALAVTGEQRLAALPDVPTFKEAGMEGMNMTVWIGAFAPKGTPAPIANRLTEEFAKAVNSPDVREQISQGGLANPRGGPPSALSRLVTEDKVSYGKLVRELNLRIE